MSQVVIGGYSPQERAKLYDYQSINTRLELLYKHFDHLSNFISRGKYRNKDPRNNVQLNLAPVFKPGSMTVATDDAETCPPSGQRSDVAGAPIGQDPF